MVIYLRREAALPLVLLLLGLIILGLATAGRPAVQTVSSMLAERLVPIYKVDTPKKQIAFSFDATWGADQTDRLLELLREHQVRTTFFLAGNWVEEYPDMVRKIAAEGHEIGNHSYAHAHMNSLTPEQIKNDISKNHVLIKGVCGYEPRLFRPPFGEYSNKVITAAGELGYQVVQWSIDSLDWKDVSADFIYNRVMAAEAGDIVLFHNAGKHTPEAVARLLPALIAKGYSIVPVGELVYKENYLIEKHSGVQRPLPPGEGR
ncbi:MAG TPA: polysaccharide deacetylase family protein [Firmicutes bacterium]|nr:polysaccharide deacetylase family protein [Bacillota bacterium]